MTTQGGRRNPASTSHEGEMMKIDKQTISLEELVAGKPIQVRFRIDVAVEDGQLAVRSPLLRDKDGEDLYFTFPVEEILRILLISSPGRAQVLQIQSVEQGTIISGYRELTVSATGRAMTKVGFWSRTHHDYSI